MIHSVRSLSFIFLFLFLVASSNAQTRYDLYSNSKIHPDFWTSGSSGNLTLLETALGGDGYITSSGTVSRSLTSGSSLLSGTALSLWGAAGNATINGAFVVNIADNNGIGIYPGGFVVYDSNGAYVSSDSGTIIIGGAAAGQSNAMTWDGLTLSLNGGTGTISGTLAGSASYAVNSGSAASSGTAGKLVLPYGTGTFGNIRVGTYSGPGVTTQTGAFVVDIPSGMMQDANQSWSIPDGNIDITWFANQLFTIGQDGSLTISGASIDTQGGTISGDASGLAGTAPMLTAGTANIATNLISSLRTGLGISVISAMPNSGLQMVANDGRRQTLRVMLFGDSFCNSDSWRPVISSLMPIVGYGVGIVGCNIGRSDNYSKWVNGFYTTVVSGSTYVFQLGDVGAVWGDTVKVFYIKEPNGGSFTVSGSTGGASVISGTVSTSGTQTGGVFTATLASYAPYAIQITGVSGTCEVIGVEVSKANTGGIIISSVARDGMNMDSMVCPAAIETPIMAAVAPDLVIYSMADDITLINTYLANQISAIAAGHPNFDMLIVGPHPFKGNNTVEYGDNNCHTIAEALRQFALSSTNSSRTFIDSMVFFGDTAAAPMAAGIFKIDPNTGQPDYTHLNVTADKMKFSRALDLSGLRSYFYASGQPIAASSVKLNNSSSQDGGIWFGTGDVGKVVITGSDSLGMIAPNSGYNGGLSVWGDGSISVSSGIRHVNHDSVRIDCNSSGFYVYTGNGGQNPIHVPTAGWESSGPVEINVGLKVTGGNGINASALHTSTTGLVSGDLWRSGSNVYIMP